MYLYVYVYVGKEALVCLFVGDKFSSGGRYVVLTKVGFGRLKVRMKDEE